MYLLLHRSEFKLKNSVDSTWATADCECKYTFSDTITGTVHTKGVIQGCGNVLHKLQTNCRETT